MYQDDVHLHPPTTVPFYILRFLRYDQHKILKVNVTMARPKNNSRSHHDIVHLHSLTNVPTKYQLTIPYSYETYPGQDFKSQSHYSKVTDKIKVTSWYCTPTLPNQCPYQVSISYALRILRYSWDNIFKHYSTARSKDKSRSTHDVGHLQPLTNVPTKCQLSTPYGSQDIARTRF